jgi:hypothetical protein
VTKAKERPILEHFSTMREAGNGGSDRNRPTRKTHRRVENMAEVSIREG